jgi:tetratricopeptide (TPR) repeat protein
MNKENEKNMTSAPTSLKGRIWLFRVLLFVIIPLLILGVFELGLNVSGYGYSTSSFKSIDIDGVPFVCDNYAFSWRFFPKQMAREFDPFIFPKEKKEKTYRVFILGSSPAQGVPDGAYSFGRILELMLRESYPGIKFEVINTSITAINSHVVRDIARDCSKHKPDLFIVYMGNNEVVGPYGPGTVFTSVSSSLSFIRMGMALKSSKIGQLISSLLPGGEKTEGKAAEWRGLEMFLGNQVAPDDKRLKAVYSHYRQNLENLSTIAASSKSNIIYCTIANNIKDNPPFASMHRKNLNEADKSKWQEFYKKGIQQEEAGAFAEALGHYKEALKIDDVYADLHFRMASCYWQAEQFDLARESFIQAREKDALKFRADLRINKIIRDVAGKSSKKHVFLADIEKTFQRQSEHQVPGKELFYEHVHMTFHGNYLLARSLFRKVQEGLPQEIKSHNLLNPQPLPEKECAQKLAYTLLDHHNTVYTMLNSYIKNPPYSNQLYHDRRVHELQQQVTYFDSLLTTQNMTKIDLQYRERIEKVPYDIWLRKKVAKFLYQRKKDFQQAHDQYQMVVYGMPHSYEGYAGLGLMLSRLGKHEEAIKQSLKATKIHPYKADVFNNLALAYQMTSKKDTAIKYYKRAIKIRPQYIPAQYNLARFLHMEGKKEEAIKVLQAAIKVNPESQPLKQLLEKIQTP